MKLTSHIFYEFAGGSIDREAGVLRRVKLLGAVSKNGRDYSRVMTAQTATLYEGSLVTFGNHTPQGKDVDLREVVGVVHNARIERDSTGSPSVYGDIQLDTGTAGAKQVLFLAENSPARIAASHEAKGTARREQNGVWYVEALETVRAVTLLSNGATASSLFESAEAQEDTTDMDWTGVQPEDVPAELRESIIAAAKDAVLTEFRESAEYKTLAEAQAWKAEHQAAEADRVLTGEVITYLRESAGIEEPEEDLVGAFKALDKSNWGALTKLRLTEQAPAEVPKAQAPPKSNPLPQGPSGHLSKRDQEIIRQFTNRSHR